MRLTIEYLLYAFLVGALIIGVYMMAARTYVPAMKSPKVSFDIAKLTVVNDGNGIYMDMQATSTTNSLFCINYIELYDYVAGSSILIGDGVNEAANLPVCIQPGNVFKLSVYHTISGGFSVGRTVLVKFYYSVEAPNSTYIPNDPQHIMAFAKVLSG